MTAQRRYDRTVAALEAFAERPIDNTPPLSSQRLRRLLTRFGDPHRAFRSVVVAGTCGKGSTAAMIAAMLRANGSRVGLFTGPHLIRYTERFRVDGREIGAVPFARRVDEALEAAREAAAAGDPRDRPSLLEVLALAACVWFRERGVEWAVMETGVGGRRDYSGALHPEACVLTAVDLDHTHLLGGTVAEIAREKCGIVRAGVPLTCSARHPDARAVVEASCRAAGAPLQLLDRDFGVDVGRVAAEGTTFDFVNGRARLARLRIPLAGRHQADNAAGAVAACRALGASDAAIRRGLRGARVAGRLERWGGSILLDGAHQPAGARALRAALEEAWAGRPVVLLLGVLGDKDREGVVSTLAPVASSVVLTSPPWSARSGALEAMAGWVRRDAGGGVPVQIEADIVAALRAARAERDRLGGDALLCVTGSLYLIGEVRRLLSTIRP